MSTNDPIVHVDGPEDPSLVILRNNDSTRYFYWPGEWTIPSWKNLSFFKKNDIEPVKIKDNFALSRYHYHGLIVWINPRLHRGLPISNFSRNFHSPRIIANSQQTHKFILIADPERVQEKDLSGYRATRNAVVPTLTSINPNNPRGYANLLVDEVGTPVQVLSTPFDADYVQNIALELIVIGTVSEIDLLENALMSLGSGEVTADSIITFFDFT